MTADDPKARVTATSADRPAATRRRRTDQAPSPAIPPQAGKKPHRRRVPRRLVHGRYRSTGPHRQLELRIDVDGVRPTNRVSGDLFQSAGGTTSYIGSFVVHAPVVTTTPGQVRIEGTGDFSFPTVERHVRVTVPRRPETAPPGDAVVELSAGLGTAGVAYHCAFASPHFRAVAWEQDSVTGTMPFVSYDTASLPQPPTSPARVLTVPTAYAEAGIDLQLTGSSDVVATAAAGADLAWNDAELHNAMVNHFSLWGDVPDWQVWLLVATRHEGGYRGIMFDYSDAHQRQGAAVFYDEIQGANPADQRAQLRTYVHELGHAFNLLHSWQKSLADPPQPLGPNQGFGDLSWMNYAWKYQPPPPDPGGEDAYWEAFPFQFTDAELVHLRHGFRRDVVMGGNPFGTGAAEIDPEAFGAPVVDHSELALTLRSRGTFRYGEPVVVELRLAGTGLEERTTHGYLHPRDGFVTIAVRQPSGRTVAYRPLMPRCADASETVRLAADARPHYESAYIGYGSDGFTFAEPGVYTVRAQYVATDGSRVVSQVHRIRVRPPASAEDERVAELLMGDEQGQLLYLLGSDSAALGSGRGALDTLLDEHGDHPLAVYARLVKGVNAERDFKDLTAGKALRVRSARPDETVAMLTPVVDASVGDEGVDNLTLNMVMHRLASAESRAGNEERAAGVLDEMVDVFTAKGLRPQILGAIADQAGLAKERLGVAGLPPQRRRRHRR